MQVLDSDGDESGTHALQSRRNFCLASAGLVLSLLDISVATPATLDQPYEFSGSAKADMTDSARNTSRLVTKILAIGTLIAPLTPEQQRAHMPQEVPDTLKLYLDGRIEQWWAKHDGSGVVFLFNLTSIDEVHGALDPLPLRVAGLMKFELIPLGPLSPLALLLK